MDNKEYKKIKDEIDLKLATEISKSIVQEMGKLETAKSNRNIFIFISVIMCIICLICIVFTSFVSIKLLDFINDITITDEYTYFDTDTGDNSSGDAINIYNEGNDSNVSNGDITNNYN